MARRFRWWHKKRGSRRSGSKLLGSLGEAIFFATLLVFGAVSLTALVVSQFVSPVETIAAVEPSGANNPDSPGEPGDPAGESWIPDEAMERATAAADEGRRLLRVVASYRYGFGFWLMTLVLTSFVVIGGSGLSYTLLHLGTSAERRAALAKRAADIDLISDAIPTDKAFPTLPSGSDLTNSPGTRLSYRLPTTESPAWQLAAAGLFGLLWNSLAVGLFVVALNSHLQGRPDWLLTLLVVPFVGVGVWSIRHLFRQLVGVTSIGLTIVEIADYPLRPGSKTQVYLSKTGRRPLRRLSVDLVCEEEANYQQGTDIRTEVCTVVRREIYRGEKLALSDDEPLELELWLEVPLSAMHSFQSAFNRVRWKLVVAAQSEGLAAYERSFPVIVYPPASPAERPRTMRGEFDDASRSVRAG